MGVFNLIKDWFGIKHSKTNSDILLEEETDDGNPDNDSRFASAKVVMDSTKTSVKELEKVFHKSPKYNRELIDDGIAKKDAKVNAFSNGDVYDPYTGDNLTLTKKEAKIKYGENWANHLAESDHRISLKNRYDETKKNPWLTEEDIKKSSNSMENLEVVSRKYNNAKRSRSTSDFVTDDAYLDKTGVHLDDESKKYALKREREARIKLRQRDIDDSLKNIVSYGHKAGLRAGVYSGATTATIAGIQGIIDVVSGQKDIDEVFSDIVSNGGKAALTGYFVSGGTTTLTHTLNYSSSPFLKALGSNNIPGNIITSVMVTGSAVDRYISGEITTRECLLEMGENGLNYMTAGYSMAVGQTLIPVPIVGAAVGALVGSVLTSGLYRSLVAKLKQKEIEHLERMRIIAECKQLSEDIRNYRASLEKYLASYFADYQNCFDEAIETIDKSFDLGDVDGIIKGSNQIIRKTGGKVAYENFDEFKSFLFEDNVDVL